MNIIDYVSSQHEPLTRFNMNESDMFVLTALSYLDFPEICSDFNRVTKLGSLAGELLAYTSHFREEKFRDFLCALAKSGRFYNLGVCGYKDEHEEVKDTLQFSAVTVKIPDGMWFISYSGTDSTVVGWKEDFQFAYMEQTSAQKKALEYINEAAHKLDGNFIVSGHSKGGNLAAYASLFADSSIQDRIVKLYCNDSPGFNDKFNILSNIGYINMQNKICCYIPQDSIVGRLLKTFPWKHFKVVRSEAPSVFYQHDIFNWQITEFGSPHTESNPDPLTYDFMSAVNFIIRNISFDMKKDFTNYLFDIFQKENVKHLDLKFLKGSPFGLMKLF
ncbi:MAG: DUF2974 domain-containing protein [Ruminococcus sp.]|nr:DUF2974 domain-containing protein [Ruminococcus sp.]MBR6386330.1 DUF2974 domain-containing protein [Ruminococcus sp.]